MSDHEICYWCGAKATGEEHVPPAGFFLPDSIPKRIKVPSCHAHNQDFAKLDERFRFYIQAAANSSAAFKAFSDKTIRGVTRPESKGFLKSLVSKSAPARLDGKKSLAFEITPAEQETFFEKISRGLYFHHTRTPFAGEVTTASTHLVNPELDYEALIAAVRGMDGDLEEGTPTDPAIFTYRFGRVVEKMGEGFLVVGCFYEDVNFFAFGVNQAPAEQDDAPKS